MARAAAAPKAIKLSKSEKSAVVKQGVPSSVAGQLRRLDTVPQVSVGKSVKGSNVAAIARKAGVPTPRIAGSGGSTQSRDIPIVPGGNLAASDSYGSLGSYGVGTATAICGDQVLAFGHPYSFAPSTKAIHGASAVAVQAAGAFSFKLANLGAPSGSLLKDGLDGILGKLGAVPNYPKVTSTTNGRQSISTVPNPDALSFTAAMQAYRDSTLVLDQDAGGTSVVTWKINYTRANNAQQSFSRTERYSSSDSIGTEITMGVAGDIETILGNQFEDVKITGVTISNAVSSKYQAYKIKSVDWRMGGKWVPKPKSGSKVKARAGRNILIRVHMVNADRKSNLPPKTSIVKWRVPKSARGASLLSVTGNSSNSDEFEDYETYSDGTFECNDDGECYMLDDDSAPKTFDQLIKQMKLLPRQDEFNASFTLASGRSYDRTRRVPATVTGSFNLKLNIRK
ncbi:hypothetical protein [Aeromicrobium sp. UC242_57]|uniref:hypothetical protein n=1 Tax=Aeromicrobium sp. UC242_57 TaxID=3374624 RepID=UPI0037B638F4